MSEKSNLQPQEEKLTQPETFESVSKIFDEAEAIFEAEGREKTKPFLDRIYAILIALNKTRGKTDALAEWNATGDLNSAQFNELNLRRKKLSNAVGILTASGVVRHDLNEI